MYSEIGSIQKNKWLEFWLFSTITIEIHVDYFNALHVGPSLVKLAWPSRNTSDKCESSNKMLKLWIILES